MRSEFESQQIASVVFAKPKFFLKKTLRNIEDTFSEKQTLYNKSKLLFEKNTICCIEVEFQKIGMLYALAKLLFKQN
jgi:hypothetical protein